jgi:hypothetical protein
MTWRTKLYVVSLKTGISYSKSLEYDKIKDYLEITQLSKEYDDYIKPNLLYFTQDLTESAKELGVTKIHSKGLYIMGVFGGEKKKGKEVYAGIALREYKQEGIEFKFKLWNTEDLLTVPLDLLKEHSIKVYKMVYVGEINPFKYRKYYNVILSEKDKSELKQFLRKAIEINKDSIPHKRTIDLIMKLIEEVEQPSSIEVLDTKKTYVIFRTDRIFTACVIKPSESNIILHTQVGSIECEDTSMAYYYAAVLNYLAYKVIELGGSFHRHQYGRPIFATCVAWLTWKDIDSATRDSVAKLSEILHKKLEKALDTEYSTQKIALKDIATKFSEFKEIIKLLDSKVDRERLKDILNIVSGKGAEEEE